MEEPAAKPTVLYNGSCPVCRREIEHYQRLDDRDGQGLGFTDISEPAPVLKERALTRDEVKRRLHVIDVDGRLLVGVPAFAAVWDHLPRYRWLSAIVRLPFLRSLVPWLYEIIAFGLYQADKRRQQRGKAAAKA
ncbi:MAG: thiol-disulfide oxidoreductase DCC family protein [Geminicoccaceae bacterium]